MSAEFPPNLRANNKKALGEYMSWKDLHSIAGTWWGAFCFIFAIGILPGADVAAQGCDTPLGRLVSLQGQVSLDKAAARLDEAVCEGALIVTGTHSRAAIQLNDRSIVRLKENSSLNLQYLRPEQPWLFKLIEGWLHFFSPRPVEMDVNTTYLNAGVRGTEFVLQTENGVESRLWVLDGRVAASEPGGKGKSLDVVTGQFASAGPGLPLRIRPLKVLLKDAVAWTLHYPPVIGLNPAAYAGAAAPAADAVDAALALFRQNRIAEAVARLDALPETERSPGTQALKASLLLYVGLVDEAVALLDAQAESATGDALLSLVNLVRGHKSLALSLAQRGVSRSPESPVPHVALSYAHQALFDLEAARSDVWTALELAPHNALAWSRLAELELSLGDYRAALAAADESVRLDAGMERTHTMLGFTRLIGFDVSGAEQAFIRAIGRDSSASLPRLGLGLARIQQGALEPGVRQLEIATSLDPETAIQRSYLGKGYYEMDLYDLAKKEFERAKRLDDRDPTPWLYDAFRAITENDPVDALGSIQESMSRNDNRAVYRSRLLLDSDEAVRSTSLGRTYAILGFDRLASLAAVKSMAQDPGNYSAHQLLSDANLYRPRHDIARVSDLLQAQIRAPRAQFPNNARNSDTRLATALNSDALAPAYNEYSRLFQEDGSSFKGSLMAGTQDTVNEEILLSAASGPASLALTQFHGETDGYRYKHYRRQNYWNLLGQYGFSPYTTVQLELRKFNDRYGEQFWGFNRNDYFDDAIGEDTESWRVGLHQKLSPSWDIAAFYRLQDKYTFIESSDGSFGHRLDEEGRQAEVQTIGRIGGLNLVAGASHFTDDQLNALNFGNGYFYVPDQIEHQNGYLYASFDPAGWFSNTGKWGGRINLTLGGAYEHYETNVIVLERFLPKLGLSVDFGQVGDFGVTFRAARFDTVKRALLSDQTLEPTTVAGFNQFYDDPNATLSEVSGVGIDVSATELGLYGGVELTYRDQDLVRFDNRLGSAVTLNASEATALAYLNWLPTPRWALAVEYEYENYNRDFFSYGFERVLDAKTHRLAFPVRYFHPSGISASIQLNRIEQQGEFFSFLGFPYSGSDRFWVVDAALHYKLPKGQGSLSLLVNNLLDEEYSYQDTDPYNPRFAPERSIYAGVTLTF